MNTPNHTSNNMFPKIQPKQKCVSTDFSKLSKIKRNLNNFFLSCDAPIKNLSNKESIDSNELVDIRMKLSNDIGYICENINFNTPIRTNNVAYSFPKITQAPKKTFQPNGNLVLESIGDCEFDTYKINQKLIFINE